MNIVMFTNTYAPMIGGAEKSIEVFAEDLRELGHRVLIVTPAFEGAETSTDQVIRLPSVKNVGATRYSVCLPFTGRLRRQLDAFAPDVLHCHQPFHLGDTALRYGRQTGLPVVFTHHTLYERYAESFDSPVTTLRRLAETLPTEFANLCDAVIAPTPSIASLIRQRGVTSPIHVAPTGIDVDAWSKGDRSHGRRQHKLSEDAVAVGHVGRLIPAKNLGFLARAVATWLAGAGDNARFLLVGDGDATSDIMQRFEDAGVVDRVIATGKLTGDDLIDAYAAMDAFVFSSLTDTQGIVLLEAMAASTPIIALDATGPRDIIEHERTGMLVQKDASPQQFADAIGAMVSDTRRLHEMSRSARNAVEQYDRSPCVERVMKIYHEVTAGARGSDLSAWEQFAERASIEWELIAGKANAAARSLTG